jgi:hypothetical protein
MNGPTNSNLLLPRSLQLQPHLPLKDKANLPGLARRIAAEFHSQTYLFSPRLGRDPRQAAARHTPPGC